MGQPPDDWFDLPEEPEQIVDGVLFDGQPLTVEDADFFADEATR